MIEHAVIDGRQATLAYFSGEFDPADKASAERVKIIFEDGEVRIIKAQPASTDAVPFDPKLHPRAPHTGEFTNSLTEHDRPLTIPEKNAVDTFIVNHRSINEAVLSIQAMGRPTLFMVGKLDDALNHSKLRMPTRLFAAGISGTMAEDYAPGERFSIARYPIGYQKIEDARDQLTGGHGLIFEIVAPAGAPALDLTDHVGMRYAEGAHEVMLPRGMQYQVIGVDHDNGTVKVEYSGKRVVAPNEIPASEQSQSLRGRPSQYVPPTPYSGHEAEEREAEYQRQREEEARELFGPETSQSWGAYFGKDDFIKAGIKAESYAINDWNKNKFGSPTEFVKAYFNGVKVDNVQIESYSDNLKITGRFKKKDGSDGGEFTRTFNMHAKTVKHALLEVAPKQPGLTKSFMRGAFNVYKKLGIKKVEVGANIDIGGYAWARYGFTPTKSSWNSLSKDQLADKLAYTGPGTYALKLKTKEKNIALKLIAKDDPRAIWAIADNEKIGKQLLINTSWGGVINLNDKAAMKRFDNYVKGGEQDYAKYLGSKPKPTRSLKRGR